MSARPTRPEPRQRSKSILSFTSNKSSKSHTSNGSIHLDAKDLKETSHEKHKRRLHTKADPSMAINEAEPAALALEKTNLESIRATQFRDSYGNVIQEPDRSNPTRSRWERPLDTIRSFEAAIDGSYSRKSIARADSSEAVPGSQSRRNSYYQGPGTPSANYPPTPGRPQQGGYYGNRWPSSGQAGQDGYDEGGYSPQSSYGPPGGRRAYGQRVNSDPMLSNQRNNPQSGYPVHNYQPSYDTATSGSGSHGTDAWGNSTDPTSSDNSSFDRLPQAPKPDPAETYGFSGFGGGIPPPAQYGSGQEQGGYGHGPDGDYFQPGSNPMPPPVPAHGRSQEPAARAPIKLGNSGDVDSSPTMAPARPEMNDKRKSWFKKRFSKG